jgi:hypothetical protein
MSLRHGVRSLTILLLSVVPAVQAQTSQPTPQQQPFPVAHRGSMDDWDVAETANFRLFHHRPRSLAEEVVRVAERTRSAQVHKWFGAVCPNWEPRCEIYLFSSDASYSEATGAPASSRGHTEVCNEGDRIVLRRIFLHGNREDLLPAVLPHEVTHAVLAGRFGGSQVPRWVDEGVAVLAEPRNRIDRHFHYLPRWREDRLLFNLRQLVYLDAYPEPRYIPAFYAQSVSLVEFLSKEKGPEVFTAFVRDGVRDGYARALRRHYGWDFTELERRWYQHAFREETVAEASGGGS